MKATIITDDGSYFHNGMIIAIGNQKGIIKSNTSTVFDIEWSWWIRFLIYLRNIWRHFILWFKIINLKLKNIWEYLRFKFESDKAFADRVLGKQNNQ